MRNYIRVFSIALLALLAAFTGTALASGAAAPEDGSLLDYAQPVFDAVTKGNYWAAAAFVVVLLVAMARKHLKWKVVQSNLGGMVAAAAISFFGAIGTTLAGPGAGALSLAVLATAGKVAFAAVGGWMILHKLATELVATKWYADKMPAPIKAVIAGLLKVVGSSAATKAKSKAAGDAAVEAKPATGTEGVVGKAREVE